MWQLGIHNSFLSVKGWKPHSFTLFWNEKIVFLLPYFRAGRSEEGPCELFGFNPPVGSYLLPALLGRAAPLTPLAHKSECLGHLLPTSGARASVLTLMQSQPLNLPFLQRAACTLQLHLSWSNATSLHGAEKKWEKLSYEPESELSPWGIPVSKQRWGEHRWEGAVMGPYGRIIFQ